MELQSNDEREGGGAHVPLVPLHILLAGQTTEVGSQRTTREGEGELSTLVNGVALGLDHKVCERVCRGVSVDFPSLVG